MIRPPASRTRVAAKHVGEHLSAWRRLQGLTAEQVSERAGISRQRLSRLENGELTVSLGAFLEVARALGRLDDLVNTLDPYESDLGRARADEILPKRVRR